MLYLASQNRLPETQRPDWTKIDFQEEDWPTRAPRLVVSCLNESNRAVEARFTEPNVVGVGSYEGCGCGFNYCTDNDVDEMDNLVQVSARVALESRMALAEYIERNRVTSLFGCWAGDEELTAECELEVSIDQLLDVGFALPERALLKMCK